MPYFKRMMVVAGTILAVSLSVCAQKTVMFDSDGNRLTDNEFVDIRMANPTYPDETIKRTLEDGTVELRLQKVPQEGMDSPAFSLKTLDGKHFSAVELRGKVVVLNLWFIGCPACWRQETVMNEAKAKFDGDDNVVFIAATADSASDVQGYVRNRPSLLLQAADAKSVVDSFRTRTFPRTIVIGRDGKIVYWRTIIHATDKLESVIRAELAK